MAQAGRSLPQSVLSFVAKNISGERAQREDGERLLAHFIEDFLSEPPNVISFLGFQSGFKVRPDLLLFRVEDIGSTLALPTSILLEPREIALQIIEKKLAESRHAFLLTPISIQEAREECIAWA